MAFEIDDEETIQMIYELCDRTGRSREDYEEVVLEALTEALEREYAKRRVTNSEESTNSAPEE